MEINRFRKTRQVAAATALVIALGASAAAAGFRFPVTTSGSAIANSRDEAEDQAHEAAREQARAICAGGNASAENIYRTGTTCTELGDGDNRRYSCLVFVRAECVTRGR